MTIYRKRSRNEVVQDALRRLQRTTPITSIGTGSIARAITEALAGEVENLNGALDFAVSNTLISSAQGRSLDLIGKLYSVERKELAPASANNREADAFYFYLDSPHNADITIPSGTGVSTDKDTYVGSNFSYVTDVTATIPAGRLRVFVPIRPDEVGSIYTAGPGTITEHNFTAPEGVTLKCTNPKTIEAQAGLESDGAYRARIIKAIRTSNGGTLEAIRFSGLSVSGVRDIKIRENHLGLGTVEVTVVPESFESRATVLTEVRTATEKSRPAGVRVDLRLPSYLSVSVEAEVFVKKSFRGRDTSGLDRRAEVSLIRYLNTLLPGDKMVYASMLEALIDSTDAIEDARFRSLTVEGREISRDSFVPQAFEQFVPGQVNVTTA